MNIFVLDEDPTIAAQMQCDKHVVKMVLESAQLLCGVVWWYVDTMPICPDQIPYKRTHINHPCAIWARASWANFDWLCRHAIALAGEYWIRYGREHKSRAVIEWVIGVMKSSTFVQQDRTPFALAMPDDCIIPNDVVASYRSYYNTHKAYMARWNKGRSAPKWFTPSN